MPVINNNTFAEHHSAVASEALGTERTVGIIATPIRQTIGWYGSIFFTAQIRFLCISKETHLF